VKEISKVLFEKQMKKKDLARIMTETIKYINFATMLTQNEPMLGRFQQ